jgi:hypothetical protein
MALALEDNRKAQEPPNADGADTINAAVANTARNLN